MRITVNTRLTKTGFDVIVQKKVHAVNYPPEVWQAFPQEFKQPYSEFVAFIRTIHSTFTPSVTIHYLFPPPLGEALFNYGLILAMPENLFDYPKSKRKTSDYLRLGFNSFFKSEFTGIAPPLTQTKAYLPQKNVALLPFSFGKDSLLTYALGKEIGLKFTAIFFIDADKVFENKHKLRLSKKFTREFMQDILLFKVPIQNLQQARGFWWGWDLMLTQYTIFLIPFMHYYRPQYFLWSNEYDRNFTANDEEGFITNPTFDQSGHWMQTLNSILRLYGINTQLGSLIDSLSELGVLAILHQRFPETAKYQSSCFNEAPTSATQRWCGDCDECAKVYVFLKAIGVDPQTVDFKDDMLNRRGKSLYAIFPEKQKTEDYWQDKFPFFREEKLYAFYLAHLRGTRGKYIEQFRKLYLQVAQEKSSGWRRTYFSMHPSQSCPETLLDRAVPIFTNELEKTRRDISRLNIR